MAFRCPYKLKSGAKQEGLDHPENVDSFKRDLLEGNWEFEGRDDPVVFWREGDTLYISEGHHRINAALEIGQENGDWSHLEKFLECGKCVPGTPPKNNIGRFPTRGWWSWFLECLGI